MTVAGWVMVGSAATSAACCLLPRAQATPRAQANAVGMLTVMVLALAVPSPFMHRAGAMLLLALAGGVGLGLVDRGSVQLRAVEAHRAAGSVLTAAALLLHQYADAGPHQHADQTVAAHTTVVLEAFTIAYAAWTLVAVLRSHASMTSRLRFEHLAMAACVGAMAFAGTM